VGRNLKGIFLVLLGLVLIIVAFVADYNKIAISDMLVPIYWIIVLFLIISGLYLGFFKKEKP